MEADIQNYLPAVMFRGTPDMFNFCLAEDICKNRSKLDRAW